MDGEGAASSLPPEAVVELLPRECAGNGQSCCLQLGSEAVAGQCQPCSIFHLLPAMGWPGRDGASGAVPVPSWPVATGAHLTQLLTQLLPPPGAGPGNRPGGSDTAADGGEQVWRGTGSTPRRRQKREVPKPSAVENNQVARWEAAGG